MNSIVQTENRSEKSKPQHDSQLRVAFAVGGLYTEASGVGRIVCDLANALARQGAPIDIYTAVCGGKEAASHMLTSPNRCLAFSGQWWGRLSASPQLKRKLEQDLAKFELIHNHSFWMLPNHYASMSAHRHRKPVVFTAHGVLEPWALARSRWKKRIAGLWFQDRDLRRAACIHVNSESEVQGIRDYGLTNPIAIIPNGVDLTPFNDLPNRTELENLHPEIKGRKICLFLSRLHEKKGLSHLIQAWGRLTKDYPDWHLVIAGPDDGYESALKQSISQLALSDTVTLTGPLYGSNKAAAMGAADVFALPSFSEGFSMAILEAMACRLPVLITPGCNFPEVGANNAGIVVAPNLEQTEQGLRDLLSMSEPERNAMGLRGRQMIETHYTWDHVAEQAIELYTWLLGGGDRPASVAPQQGK